MTVVTGRINVHTDDVGGVLLSMWCPGCDEPHTVRVDITGGWTHDGNYDAPTIAPSIRVSNIDADGNKSTQCHSFVRDGRWEFLNDCRHPLAGHTVPVPPWPRP